MSKVSAYLQEHILGEVLSSPQGVARYSTDASVLAIKPEMVVRPLVTNDIRKVLRFSWQLAEKGHELTVTARGGGSDTTGAALGNGVIIDTACHMNKIFEFDQKQKLVRLQPGISAHALQEGLRLRGVSIPPLETLSDRATVGGAIANDVATNNEAKYGRMAKWVGELEVVLANGDVLQTNRLSRRDLDRKKGQQTMEGELYRAIDNLIEDNKELIDSIDQSGERNRAGYPGIAQVKTRDGFNLAPLFAGSQGTLGIISEMILKCEFSSFHISAVLLAFAEKTDARDAFDDLEKTEPAFCEYYDAEYFAMATKLGKKYSWFDPAKHAKGAVIICGFDDFADRVRAKKVKRVQKMFAKSDAEIIAPADNDMETIVPARSVVRVAQMTTASDQAYVPVFDNFFVPPARFEDFTKSLMALAKKHDVSLTLHGDILMGVYSAQPLLHLRRVGDKQKVFKLLDEMTNLVHQHDGALIGRDGEGRLKTKFAHKHLDKDVAELYAQIKAIFDPHGILNPGVKADVELRTIAGSIRNEY